MTIDIIELDTKAINIPSHYENVINIAYSRKHDVYVITTEKETYLLPKSYFWKMNIL